MYSWLYAVVGRIPTKWSFVNTSSALYWHLIIVKVTHELHFADAEVSDHGAQHRLILGVCGSTPWLTEEAHSAALTC